jgi:multidrug transporter EmrE-like cation transporter
MNVVNVLLSLINGYKTYAAVILAIVSGLGLILVKNHDGGIVQICQALLLVFAGASVVGLRHAVAKVPIGVIDAASRRD